MLVGGELVATEVCGDCADKGVLLVVPSAVASARAIMVPMVVHLRKLAKAYELNEDGRADGIEQAADILESGRAIAPDVIASTSPALPKVAHREPAPIIHRDPKPPNMTNGAALAATRKPLVLEELTAGERRILSAVVSTPRERTVVAFLAAYSKGGGAFSGSVGRLVDAGYLEKQGHLLAITRAGCQALGSRVEPLLTGQPLLEHWVGKLGACAGAILRLLVVRHPQEVARADIASLLDYEAAGGAFSGAMGALRRRELIDRRQYRASSAMMEAYGS